MDIFLYLFLSIVVIFVFSLIWVNPSQTPIHVEFCTKLYTSIEMTYLLKPKKEVVGHTWGNIQNGWT